MLDTLPERVLLARQQKLPHQDFLSLVLSDEATRRDSLAVALRVQCARLDPAMHLDAWDPTAKVTFDRALLNELTALRFLDVHAHVAIVGPVGVGKTFLAHALGHIATRFRATAVSFCFNAPRLIAFVGPLVAGTLITAFGNYGRAAIIVSTIYLVGVVAAPFFPETRGRPLPD